MYRLRPTRAGEAVLPPVAIAAFDPALTRYVTHVTAGVPIRVVAVPAFDPATIDDGIDGPRLGRTGLGGVDRMGPLGGRCCSADTPCSSWFGAACAAAGFMDRPRPGDTPRVWPVAWNHVDPRAGADSALDAVAERPMTRSSLLMTAARRVSEELIHYLQLGIGRPAGALTPDEARQGVCNSDRLRGSGQRKPPSSPPGATGPCTVPQTVTPGAPRTLGQQPERCSKHSGESRARDGDAR